MNYEPKMALTIGTLKKTPNQNQIPNLINFKRKPQKKRSPSVAGPKLKAIYSI